MNWITDHAKGVTLLLTVQPGAPKNSFVGIHGDTLKIRINAPPVDGAANDEIVSFFSKSLGVRKSQVQILSGETGKKKRLLITGMSLDQISSSIRETIRETNEK